MDYLKSSAAIIFQKASKHLSRLWDILLSVWTVLQKFKVVDKKFILFHFAELKSHFNDAATSVSFNCVLFRI